MREHGSKLIKAARALTRALDSTVDFVVLIALLLMLSLAGYAMWDAKQVYASASPAKYTVFKPTEDPLSFQELKALNDDVQGWLTIYGTGIDYPLLYSKERGFYLNRDPEKSFSTAGSIYLDFRNSADFSDYNSIIHGHNMENSCMFGDISRFNDSGFFESHLYGNLYFNGRNHGLVIFEYALVDAYDKGIYRIAGDDAFDREQYLCHLEECASQLRDCGQKEADTLLIMSTCSAELSNGRSILAAYLAEDIFDDPFYTEPEEKEELRADSISLRRPTGGIPLWLILVLVFLLLLLIDIAYRLYLKRRRKEYLMTIQNKNEGSK